MFYRVIIDILILRFNFYHGTDVKFSKYVSTIYLLLTALFVLSLSSGMTYANITSVNQASHILSLNTDLSVSCELSSYSEQHLDSNCNEPNCCELYGTCYVKQCCSHHHVPSNSAIFTLHNVSYGTYYTYEPKSNMVELYTNIDISSQHRPPIL